MPAESVFTIYIGIYLFGMTGCKANNNSIHGDNVKRKHLQHFSCASKFGIVVAVWIRLVIIHKINIHRHCHAHFHEMRNKPTQSTSIYATLYRKSLKYLFDTFHLNAIITLGLFPKRIFYYDSMHIDRCV